MGVEQMGGQTIQVVGGGFGLHALAPVAAAAMFAQPQLVAAGERTQAQVDVGLATQARQRRLDLVEQGAAHLARADHRQRDGLW